MHGYLAVNLLIAFGANNLVVKTTWQRKVCLFHNGFKLRGCTQENQCVNKHSNKLNSTSTLKLTLKTHSLLNTKNYGVF